MQTNTLEFALATALHRWMKLSPPPGIQAQGEINGHYW
jgi:hypothetical protein